MRILSRTSLATGTPDPEAVMDHLRVTVDLAAEADRLVRAAQREIEDHAGLVFYLTTIVCLSQPEPGTSLRLPIGPLAASPTVTVYNVDEAGVETVVVPTQIIGGTHPEIILATAPEWKAKVTYRAGFGSTWAEVPEDLRLAALDHALRLFDMRGNTADAPVAMSPAAARIAARYRRLAFA